MYILKESKKSKNFNGKSRLTNQQYKLLAENLKLYYRKFTDEDAEREFEEGTDLSRSIIEDPF